MFLTMSTKSPSKSHSDQPAVNLHALPDPVVVRSATDADSDRLRTLAALDDRRLPSGPFLVGELSGETVAALSLATGTVVADPFRRTGDAADMLRLRAQQIA